MKGFGKKRRKNFGCAFEKKSFTYCQILDESKSEFFKGNTQ